MRVPFPKSPVKGKAVLQDRYHNPISTTSQTARDHYITAVDRVISANAGMVDGFETALKADPDFALGYVGLARAHQLSGDMPAARAAMEKAQSMTKHLSSREAAHVNCMSLLIAGKMALAYPAIREHVGQYPRDVLIAQTCTSVFGLIGFSGQPGREAELLAYTTTLAQHYGDDWWYLSQQAFSLGETGQTARAAEMIERSLAINPRNANGAHVKSHIHYENGETKAGATYLEQWLGDYDRSALLHGHLSWHVALWALEQGDPDRMWQMVDDNVVPGVALGLPINVLTDTASILYRAELLGQDVSPDRWTEISDYARQFFPKPGLGFADVHAAIAHAMAGNCAALDDIQTNAAGPAADLVREFAQAYRAIANNDWTGASNHLTQPMADHARIGGSRAQRDLLEYTLLQTLLKQDRTEEAKHLLALRRPVQAGTHPVLGM